jgi:transposase
MQLSPLHKIGNAKPFHVEHRTNDRRSTVQIVDLNTEEMIDICVRLVREGVTFRASPMGYGTWMIVFTGGY